MTSILVLELVSSGFFGGEIGPSFQREGRAMLDAVLHDLHRLPDLNVITWIDQAGVDLAQRLRCELQQTQARFSLIIAPEFDHLLAEFCAAAEQPGRVSLNCSAEVLEHAGDKWRFAEWLLSRGLPGIPTALRTLAIGPNSFPSVVKPRFGAGSWLVRLLQKPEEWTRLSTLYHQAGCSEVLCQPLVAGQALSIGVLVRPRQPPELLPIAGQRLSDEGEFRYLGGEIPAAIHPDQAHAIRKLVTTLVTALPGLQGYIGIDLILPATGAGPVIVELNPRLTTSYIGYQHLCLDNLMERLLSRESATQPLRWKPGRVVFDADGTCRSFQQDSVP